MLMIIYWVEAYYTEKHKALVVARKENGLEVNADKTKYMISRLQLTMHNKATIYC
jgi:hypothetical protein